MTSIEQSVRDILFGAGVEDAHSFTAEDFTEGANKLNAVVAEIRAQALEEAAQLCEEFLRSFRGMAEDGDHFETLVARIRALK